ncbi:lipopolysaccharide biosynthesis protein [Clostridium sp. DJ247]|uniref:lipopolysaccharide biosynthesis protein n=1 Tax=Clostridium sp. DJ247 TaxID=2726188 RepID=UPI00162867B4|nr:lipopolysaccharide biosynthesis protein [Clostridium sp. DJ247]MBC2581942.1 lipopolysaccharide biosynthesis protein [Clostridium sp. DJ247]
MSTVNIRKAALINCIAKYSNVIIQLIINSILARLLTPNEFGIVAVIMVFISFFNILADMGIGPAIIQNKELNDRNISNIFLFTLFTGIILSISFSFFSYGIAYFYTNSIYIKLGRILSLSIFFSIANIVPSSLMLKQKRFKDIGIITVSINIIVGFITIILAMKGSSYYSLIINSVITNALLFFLNLFKSKLKIYFVYSNDGIKIIKNYSAYQFGFNFVNYFSRNLDNILIGKFMGDDLLGFYDKAYKLMLYPLQNLTFVITPVLHPILSDYQDNKEVIYEYFLKVIKLLSLLGVYVAVICFFCADEIVIILFGEKWIRSIPSFKILSISIWIQMISSCSGSIFQATGRTRELFKCGIFTTISTITCVLIGLTSKTIEYVAIGVVISFFINFLIVCYLLIYIVLEKSIYRLIKEIYKSMLIAIFMILAMNLINVNCNNIILSITLKVGLATVIYILSLLITKELVFIKHVFRKQ